MKSYGWSVGVPPLIFKFSTRRRLVVKFTPQPPYPNERNPVYMK